MTDLEETLLKALRKLSEQCRKHLNTQEEIAALRMANDAISAAEHKKAIERAKVN
jgi:hypothetical protein